MPKNKIAVNTIEAFKEENPKKDKKIIKIKTNIVFKGISFAKGSVDINNLNIEDRKNLLAYLKHNNLIEKS